MSTFSIPNEPFSEIFNLTIHDLLQADPNALQIMVMAYRYFDNKYEQKIYQGESQVEISNEITEKNEILATIDFKEEDFTTLTDVDAWYATYVVTYNNELVLIGPSYKKINEEFTYEFNVEANDEKPVALLQKWINLDSVKVTNILVDEHKYFYIGKNRKIVSENSDKSDNVILTKDNDSEEITWRLPRYYDGIDLITKNISIYYIRPVEKDNTQGGESEPQGLTETLTVEKWDDNYLWATWVVTDLVTNTAGVLTYSIIVEGDGLKDEYFWQSYPSTFLIEEGIYGNLPTGEKDFSFIDKKSFRTDIYQTIEELKAIHEAGEIKWQSLADLL